MPCCPSIIERSRSSGRMSKTEISSDDMLGLEQQQDNRHSRTSSKLGKVILGVTGAAAIGLVLVTTPFVTPALRKICLPYVPATERQISNILLMAQVSKCPGPKLVDLGSGDGRVVIAAAKHGYQAHGYELNQWLVWYSRIQARLQGLHGKATFSRADLWKMQKLEAKFQVELKDDAEVLAFRFPLPNWKPTKVIEEGIDSVWLYQKQK
ncbi:ATP synthase subunit C lysine N-methyltransferase-like isoform X2 [Porites lutea]|uniref:ATP synthase subunit C lysine N-methyltransferase-like isoform X2 n=1 Tax=Porites lutea TaxID=51062 RepID=UPI003CC5F5D6